MREIPISSVYGDPATGKFNWKLLLKMIDGDIIYACKPYGSSFGLGILAKITKRKPLILDLDDYEPGFYGHLWKKMPLTSKITGFIPALRDPRSYQWMLLLHKLMFLADAITVSNKQLRELYGGTVITHAVDTDKLTPTPHVNKKPVIGYIGTIRPHKGLLDLIKALVLLRHLDYTCVITAAGDGGHLEQVMELARSCGIDDRINIIRQESYSNINNLLSTIDIIVIPQRNTVVSQYQTPAKLLDAMATGKVIIASNMPPIADMLNKCGFYCNPNDLYLLTRILDVAIRKDTQLVCDVLDGTGIQARHRCVKHYDLKVVRKQMNKVIRGLI